jgi:SAM-dependent methyltransferase
MREPWGGAARMKGQLRPLQGEYYSACHTVFRDQTNQGELMIEETLRLVDGSDGLAISSVGSGIGLFEIPLLQRLGGRGRVDHFTGVDVDEYACDVLRSRLQAEFDGKLDFDVYHDRFENFSDKNRFDLVIFNHVLEYFEGDPLPWIEEARAACTARGRVLIFSPNRGGINKMYELTAMQTKGAPPLFSDGIEASLTRSKISFEAKMLPGICNTQLLEKEVDDGGKIMFLSFLTHIDCRDFEDERNESLAGFYLSLRDNGTSWIPHPTTLFIV